MIDKARLLGLTDAVIAVAVTVMALRLDIPEKVSWAAVTERAPVMLAYIISYAQIFLAWHEHHDSLVKAEKINHSIFLVNTLWLFLITLLPFITGVVGRSPNHTPTVLLYLCVLAAQEIVLIFECRLIERLNGIEIRDARVIRRIRILTLSGIALAALIAFFLPLLSMAVVVGISIASVIVVCVYDRELSKRYGEIPGQKTKAKN